MFELNSITLLVNGLTLTLALSLLLILLWHDARKLIIQVFAVFLLMVILWNLGSLFIQAMLLALIRDQALMNLAIGVMEVGFSASSVALYVLITLLVGVHLREFRTLALLSLLIVVIYRLVLIVTRDPTANTSLQDYQFQTLPIVFYYLFDLIAMYLIWTYRRKIRNNIVVAGTLVFAVGQGIAFLNQDIPIVALSTNVSAVGALVLCMGIIRQEIILPLAERESRVDASHKVSLAITSQLSIDTVLHEIAVQAAGWLGADGVGIFLRKDDELELVNLHQLPRQMLHYRIKLGDGVAGVVAQTGKSIYLENYSRDWAGEADMPSAKQTFGSVIGVPLLYAGNVMGTLLVIAGRRGHLFNQTDVQQLERLGAQAAVAISHSHLFQEVEEARNQLEALLTSTENPVIAVNRKLKLIFANPAAKRVFRIPTGMMQQRVDAFLPQAAFPKHIRQALRDIRFQGTHMYEVLLDQKTYLCHLTALGSPRLEGWVAVLNDVTQLKELDRVKSEMVRMASHDLKNPLMGAMLYLDLAKEQASGEVSGFLVTIERQLERMSRIIRGVLDLEQTRSGLKANTICNAYDILMDVVKDIQKIADNKHITLIVEAYEPHLQFSGDREQIERALMNLVENAVKFTAEGGRVIVGLYQQVNTLVYKVADNGIGIPREMHQQVFERFFRGQQRGAEHITGSGLGLSIVKTIVENHRGKVWLESEIGHGTTFFVSLPIVMNTIKTKDLAAGSLGTGSEFV